MNSHYIFRSSANKVSINEVKNICFEYLAQNPQIENYSSEILTFSKKIEFLINNFIYKKVSLLLNSQNPVLSAVELHIQRPFCKPIPPHQDNFYHCINPNKGLKVLIPLQNLSPENGGLIYLNIDNNFPIMQHSPTKIMNFSAFIDDDIFNKLRYGKTSYELDVGDVVFHFMNSIHYSLGNKTPNESLFLVYRFQCPNAKQDKEAEKKYKKCYDLHIKNFNRLSN